MSRRKMKIGLCHLCGEKKPLSFEHIPPRCSFNENTKYYVVSYLDYMKESNPFDKKIKGKIEQGGIGKYSLCQSCNNFLGKEYVKAYKRWAYTGMIVLTQNQNRITYTALRQNPNRILKHILSMFIAINESWFSEEYSELKSFINDVNSTDLPNRFKVYTYLNNGPNIRYLSFLISGNIETHRIIKSTEIAFPPYGFVLSIDSDIENDQLLEITYFKDLLNITDLDISINKLQTATQIPLDYRSMDEVKRKN
jgi:hypothetical protein